MLVSSGLWRRRRATTRAAVSGASTRRSPRRGRCRGAAPDPYGYEADKGTVRESEAVVIRECARRLLAGEALRSICADLDEREVRDGDREGVEAADAQADADVGPDQRAAGASRRACRNGGVAGDHHAGGDDPHPRAAVRSGAGVRTRLPVATCWCGCCVAAVAGRRSCRGRRRAASARTCARKARATPAAAASPCWPTRWRRSWSRPSCTGSTRPSSLPP